MAPVPLFPSAMRAPPVRKFPRLLLAGGVAVVFVGAQFVAAQKSDSRAVGPVETVSYVGNATCISCHRDKGSSFDETAHANTSCLATPATVKGRFDAGANDFRTANPDLYFQLRAAATGCTQTAVLRTSATEVLTRTERMDIVIGSGRKGQTYLYWDGDGLFELPVSYWTEAQAWVNSPGYIDGRANFERPIPRRCLECHATSFVSRGPPENAYARDSLRLGISCEKCHGPGAEHVARFRSASPPKSPVEFAILNPKKLPRDRQIDSCALCHAGAGDPLTPPLSFQPGDELARHLTFPRVEANAPLDVHASQVQLLERSQCFRSTPAMSCSSCHDVHRPQRDLASFAAQCIRCHQPEKCGEFSKEGHRIDQRCVTCHMPLEKTEQIIIASAPGRSLQPEVRNHRIAIYPSRK